jgi:hypothetical protein
VVSGVLVAGHPDIHDFDDDFPFLRVLGPATAG